MQKDNSFYGFKSEVTKTHHAIADFFISEFMDPGFNLAVYLEDGEIRSENFEDPMYNLEITPTLVWAMTHDEIVEIWLDNHAKDELVAAKEYSRHYWDDILRAVMRAADAKLEQKLNPSLPIAGKVAYEISRYFLSPLRMQGYAVHIAIEDNKQKSHYDLMRPGIELASNVCWAIYPEEVFDLCKVFDQSNCRDESGLIDIAEKYINDNLKRISQQASDVLNPTMLN